MAFMTWDNTGEKLFETGVRRGVLYPADSTGAYTNGTPWNGLTGVTESPSGAEANKFYANNAVYATIMSAEELAFTIEAYTYPDEFAACDGSAELTPGVTVGQQTRKGFGYSYVTQIGNDLESVDHGYKIHLIYGCLASPSEKAFATINDSPEPTTMSWEVNTTPVNVTGRKPTSLLVIDSTKVPAAAIEAIEAILYDDTAGRLPTPDEVYTIITGAAGGVTPQAVTFNSATNTATIPTVAGGAYHYVADVNVTQGGSTVLAGATLAPGAAVIAANAEFSAVADGSTTFDPAATTEWAFVYTP